MKLLYTSCLRKEFGGLVAVNDVDFEVEGGTITGLIGPNGAGKTTLFNTITGLDEPTEGFVFFEGRDITGWPAYRIARLGISRTFQNIRLFRELNVFENVMIGRHFKGTHPFSGPLGVLNAFYALVNSRNEERDIYENAWKWLEFVGVEKYHAELPGNLPYGIQRKVEIARALAMEPKLLFLDEPAAGMNPVETEELMGLIRRIRDLGITVVLIEHDMKLVMNICDTITVLNYGQKIASGTPKEIQAHPQVVEAYLGRES
ncbi:MAG: ABC transporter ATP-binding protein [Brevinematales bacterium]|nr:ABC transporter ATP-binding protein [Brevinematales bacterium]